MTTKITSFDKSTARLFQAKAESALRALAAEFGVSVRQAGGTIDGLKARLKFEFKVEDQGAMNARAREEYLSLCALFDMTPEQFGGAFIHRGTVYTVAGLEPGRSKFPIRAKRAEDGKVVLFPATIAASVQPAASTPA
jgi:hypothetical protein